MMGPSSAPGSKPSLTDSGTAETRGFSFQPLRGDLLGHVSPIITAVMVDAGFFVKRLRALFGVLSPETAAKKLHRIVLEHLHDGRGRRTARLYRIFVYDASPAVWMGHTPLTRRAVDLANTPVAG